MSGKTLRSSNADPIWMHLRVRYFRPSWQGGDTEHPLCMVPLFGWSGTRSLDCALTDKAAAVDCPRCAGWMAKGGVSARRARLFQVYVKDCGRASEEAA